MIPFTEDENRKIQANEAEHQNFMRQQTRVEQRPEDMMARPAVMPQQTGFNPEQQIRAQYDQYQQKPYMPQRQMTQEQQRMQNIMGLYTPDHYQQQQQRGMTMDMPQYGSQQAGLQQLLAQMQGQMRGGQTQQRAQQATQEQLNAQYAQFLQRGDDIAKKTTANALTQATQANAAQLPSYKQDSLGYDPTFGGGGD
jgi:hypothetical protein